MKKSKEELQEFANHASVQGIGRVTLTLDVTFDRGYPSKEEILRTFKEWFDDERYPIHVRMTGHAARENTVIANSVDIQDVEWVFNKDLPEKNDDLS